MISLLCPTRGRPHNLRRLIESVRRTESAPLEIVVYVDDDDPAYPADNDAAWAKDARVIRGPRICHSDYWNKCAAVALGDILMMIGDDCIFRTAGWDAMVEAAFARCPDKILMCHGNDLGPAGKWFATHPIISRRWVEITGRFTGPWFPGDFADQWLQDMANALGRRQFLPFVNEHMHAVWGKAPKDQVYCDNEDRRQQFNTPMLFEQHRGDLVADTQKLFEAMDPDWWITLPSENRDHR